MVFPDVYESKEKNVSRGSRLLLLRLHEALLGKSLLRAMSQRWETKRWVVPMMMICYD